MSIKFINNIPFFKSALERATEEAVREIKIKAVGEVKSNTPVKKGILKRSFEGKEEELSRAHFRVIIGSKIHYAPIVNFKGKSRRFFTNTLERFRPEAQRILVKNIKKIKGIK